MTHYSITFKHNHYGIKIIKEKTVDNISDDYTIIKLLVDSCNKFQVDFEHFEDILENFLGDCKTF